MFREVEKEEVDDSNVLQAVAMTNIEKEMGIGLGIKTGPDTRIEDQTMQHYRLLLYASIRTYRYLQVFLSSEHKIADKNGKVISQLSEAPTDEEVQKFQDFVEDPEIKDIFKAVSENDQKLIDEGVAFL